MLRFLRHHGDLLSELEARGLGDEAGQWLRFVTEHEMLFRELRQLGLAAPAASWLRLLQQHPTLFQYLADRPSLADDANRCIAEVSRGGAFPKVRLLGKMLPGWLAGKYKFSRMAE